MASFHGPLRRVASDPRIGRQIRTTHQGYFGTIEYEEMQSAFHDILEIERLIQEDLETANG
jgi:hypothetical protein